jgi:hypothetical protein
VGKIYLYDNRSKQPLASAVLDYIRAGFVEYQYFSGLDMAGNKCAAGGLAAALAG